MDVQGDRHLWRGPPARPRTQRVPIERTGMTETIDAEAIEDTGTEIAVREPAAPALFGTDDPGQIIEKAKKVAVVLNDVITQQKLFTTISGKRYVLVEGW